MDANELLEMAAVENDVDTVESVTADLAQQEKELETLEFQRMFSGEMEDRKSGV